VSNPQFIPFNRPFATGEELELVRQAMESGHLSGDGQFTKKCHALLEKEVGTRKALLTTSCTHALEMAALLLNVGPGDEVIVPSFTFVSTANAFALRGAKIIFADVREDTLNLDETRLPSLMTARTKAVVPVHYAGVACEMMTILDVAKSRGAAVVEDAAHGLSGSYQGRPLGSIGDLGTFSFHETKNYSCGEGGALVINREDLVERAEIIREKGTDRSKFFRGQVDKYSWVDLGSSFLPSEILAASLFAQLKSFESIKRRRGALWQKYHSSLQDWANRHDVRLPKVPDHASQAFHMFFLIFPRSEQRDAFNRFLKERSISACFHYLPLHVSRMGTQFGGRPGDCPVTESISGRLTRLPFFTGMTPEEQERVISAVLAFEP
jgi:dTDP-4-amino-4,6-dideoxygalactose transaminase